MGKKSSGTISCHHKVYMSAMWNRILYPTDLCFSHCLCMYYNHYICVCINFGYAVEQILHKPKDINLYCLSTCPKNHSESDETEFDERHGEASRFTMPDLRLFIPCNTAEKPGSSSGVIKHETYLTNYLLQCILTQQNMHINQITKYITRISRKLDGYHFLYVRVTTTWEWLNQLRHQQNQWATKCRISSSFLSVQWKYFSRIFHDYLPTYPYIYELYTIYLQHLNTPNVINRPQLFTYCMTFRK